MKRRRYITFGFALAMALSVGTVSYGAFVAYWNGRSQNLFGPKELSPYGGDFTIWRLWSRSGEGYSFEIAERSEELIVQWTLAGVCPQCSQRGSCRFDCRGNAVSRPSQASQRHQWGPVHIAKSVYGRNTRYSLKIPYWLPMFLLAAYPALYFFIAGIRRFRRRPGHCLHCAYDLTGNESGVCPECGTAVAPLKSKEK